jgi:hypothetical protein
MASAFSASVATIATRSSYLDYQLKRMDFALPQRNR